MPLDEQRLIKEFLRCPICVEIPLTEVFQCENGHVICDQCILKVALCPVCRIAYGRKRIRALAIEAILNEVELNCSVDNTTSITNNSTRIYVDVDDIPTHPLNQTKYMGSFKYMKAEIKGKMEPFIFLVKTSSGSKGRNINCAVLYLGDGPSPTAQDFVAKIDVEVVFLSQKKKQEEEHKEETEEQEEKQDEEEEENYHGRDTQTKHFFTWTGPTVNFKKASEDDKIIPYFVASYDYIKSQLVPEDLIFIVDVKVQLDEAVTKDESISDSSDEHPSDESDGHENWLSSAYFRALLQIPFGTRLNRYFKDYETPLEIRFSLFMLFICIVTIFVIGWWMIL